MTNNLGFLRLAFIYGFGSGTEQRWNGICTVIRVGPIRTYHVSSVLQTFDIRHYHLWTEQQDGYGRGSTVIIHE